MGILANSMKKEYNIEELVQSMDFSSGSFSTLDHGIMLTNREIEVLKRYGIDYLSCQSLKEIIYKIEDLLEDEFHDSDELEEISISISERDYYQNTNK